MPATEGEPAPDFSLKGGDGSTVTLSDLRGQNVVVYFYPKDDTPGCTREACSFRDNLGRLKSLGAVVLGLSPDSPASHRKFAEKFGLPYTLLADEDHRVAEDYGAWVEKMNYGKRYMGIGRSTFVIDRTGTIRKVFRKVKVDGHVDKVMESVRSLG